MPVDLDELFDELRRQADSVPLAGAASARARGRRRGQVRVVATVAVVVALVVVGTGLAVRPGPAVRHDTAAMPTVGTPLRLDGRVGDVQLATDGLRAYVAWTRWDGDTVWMATTDVRTGAVLSGPQRVSASEALQNVVVTPSGVVVVTKPRTEPPDGFRYYLFDSRTGGALGDFGGDDAEGDDAGQEDWVFAGDHLAAMLPPGGQVSINPVSGSGYTGFTSSDVPYARLLGWGTTADEQSVNQSGPSVAFADSRVVMVTLDGVATVFDTRTGKPLRTVPLGLVSGKRMAVFDGTLAMTDPRDSPTGPQRLRFVDLSGGDAGAWETGAMPGAVVAMNGCGPGLVCAVTSAGGRTDRITAFDVRQRRIAWQDTTAVTGNAQLSTANGRTLVAGTGGFGLYDPDGRRIVTGSTAFNGVWLDPRALLVEQPAGTLARLPIGGRAEPVGRTPAGTLGCTSTSTRLVCITATALTTWNVG